MSISPQVAGHILLATRNPTKRLLFAPTFERYGFEVLTLRDAGLDGHTPPETSPTPLGNALAKARRHHSPRYPWVFGDDAGLEIDALHGEPGLEARRWGGHFTDDVDDETWLRYLLARLEGVPPERRTAAFVSGWALLAPDGSEHTRVVRFPFRIAEAPLRPISPGSPLSAVMIGPEDCVGSRSRELAAEFEAWGILPFLLARFSR